MTIATEDKVAVRWTARGTHEGNYCLVMPSRLLAALAEKCYYLGMELSAGERMKLRALANGPGRVGKDRNASSDRLVVGRRSNEEGHRDARGSVPTDGGLLD